MLRVLSHHFVLNKILILLIILTSHEMGISVSQSQLAPPQSLLLLSSVGLLGRGILTITQREYFIVRKDGFKSRKAGGVSKDPMNLFPERVSLALSRDSQFASSALGKYGPIGHTGNVTFVIDPEYVRNHPDQFQLKGGVFLTIRQFFSEGLKLLGLDQNLVSKGNHAYPDEIQATEIPASAIAGVIVHPKMKETVLKWEDELMKLGLKPIKVYLLNPAVQTNELRPELVISSMI